MILFCYDGSADARRAVETVSALLPNQPAIVLTVWEGLAEVFARTHAGHGVTALEIGDIDDASARAALARAEAGAELARKGGLLAEPRAIKRAGTIWETILAVGDELDCSAIVLGSRGLTGLKSLLLGSVSHAVLQHADRSVIVVPSEPVAAKRKARHH